MNSNKIDEFEFFFILFARICRLTTGARINKISNVKSKTRAIW